MGMVEMAIFNIQRAITLNVGKQELRFMCSACHLMVFNIYVKFHENMSSYGTDTKVVNKHTQKRKLYTPLHCILHMPGVYPEIRFMCFACRLMV